MIVKKTKQLGNFKKGINLHVPKRTIATTTSVGSLLFNDPSQFLQFPRSEVISILAAEPFTIEAWIKPTSIKTIAAVDANGNPDPLDYGDIIIGDTQDGGNNWSLQLFNNKLTFYRYKNEVTGFKFFTSNTQIPLDAWTHVAVSYDGDSTLLIFINGVLDATFADYSPPDTEFSVITIGNLWLSGTSASGGGAFAYKGYITNLRINDNQIFYHMVSPFEPTAPLGYVSGTTLLLLANTNDPTKDSSPGDVTITNVGSVASSAQYPTVTDCANNDAKVLMVGWSAGARPLTRDNENLYTYYAGGSPGDETVYRANSSSPWIYTNVGIPLATSLTVSQFPWQAIWPTSPTTYTATKVCPAAPDIDNMFFPSLWLDASTGVNKFDYNYISEIVISGTSNPSFSGAYTANVVPNWNSEDNGLDVYFFNGPAGKTMSWSLDDNYFILNSDGADSFTSSDGVNWTIINSYLAEVVITGVTGVYSNANGTYTRNNSEDDFNRVGGGFYISPYGVAELRHSDTSVLVATNNSNLTGAWTATSFINQVTIAGANNTPSVNGVYTRSQAGENFTGPSPLNFNIYDEVWELGNEDYESSDLVNWGIFNEGTEPVPNGVTTTALNSIGSVTSTVSSIPSGSITGTITTSNVVTDNVVSWTDQSASGRNAVNSNGFPVYNLVGGKSFLSFGSYVDMLVPSTIWDNVQFVGTIFVVARFASSTSGTTARLLFQEGVDGNFVFSRGYNNTNAFAITTDEVDFVSSLTNADNNTNYILGATFSESNVATVYLNGISNGTGGVTNNTGTVNTIIGGAEESSNIAEIIVYNRVLNTSERQEVESYLMEKYAITAA